MCVCVCVCACRFANEGSFSLRWTGGDSRLVSSTISQWCVCVCMYPCRTGLNRAEQSRTEQRDCGGDKRDRYVVVVVVSECSEFFFSPHGSVLKSLLRVLSCSGGIFFVFRPFVSAAAAQNHRDSIWE